MSQSLASFSLRDKFSKADRFPKLNTLTSNVSVEAYDKKTTLKQPMTTRSFGSTTTRFNQYKKKGNSPSPNQYQANVHEAYHPANPFSSPKNYSFGVSRDSMKKVYVDTIFGNP